MRFYIEGHGRLDFTAYAVVRNEPDGTTKILEVHLEKGEADRWAGHYGEVTKSCTYAVIPLTCLGE